MIVWISGLKSEIICPAGELSQQASSRDIDRFQSGSVTGLVSVEDKWFRNLTFEVPKFPMVDLKKNQQ